MPFLSLFTIKVGQFRRENAARGVALLLLLLPSTSIWQTTIAPVTPSSGLLTGSNIEMFTFDQLNSRPLIT